MEKQLSYVLILPRLEQIALRRVASVLWTEPDILASIGKFRESIEYVDYQKKWRETVECEVSDKISKLKLPKLLKEQLIPMLKPVGLQILRWKIFHEIYLSPSNYISPCEYIDVPILEKLCWTAAGTVDYRKTAEELVSCDVVDIVKRYKLACLYCLDHYIPEFWKELSPENKMHFYNEDDLSHIRQPLLQFCWPYILKGEEHKLDGMPGLSQNETFHQHIFSYLSFTGNITAVKYFFQKLSQRERKASLISKAFHALKHRFVGFHDFPWRFPKANSTDVVFHLLSQMTPEQEIRIFRARPSDVLMCFWDWPWQSVFLDVADTMWPWIQCDDLQRRARNYRILIEKMERSIQYSDCFSPTLYLDFFLRTPSDFRKQFVNQEWCLGNIFRALFNIQDVKTINVILKNVDAIDRRRLASSKHIFAHFFDLISRGKGHVAEMCLRGTGLCKEDKRKVKNRFVEFLKRRYRKRIDWGAPELVRFFQFLDEADVIVHSKRSSDAEASTEVKKFCCKKEKNLTR